MDIIKVFFDVETTGLNPRLHTLHQLAGVITINDAEHYYFDFKCRPFEKARVEPEALETCRITEAELMGRAQSFAECYEQFSTLMKHYIDPYNKAEKAHLIGYNNRSFDDIFLRALFDLNGDEYFGSLFWSDSIDVLCLASQYLQKFRHEMPNFKLATVAQQFRLPWESSQAHNANYDARKTKDIYDIIRLGL